MSAELGTDLAASAAPIVTAGVATGPARKGRLQNAMPARRPNVARFSVSLPSDLLDELDDMVARRKFPSRSHAIADMAREKLLEHAQELGTKTMAGTISLVYDYRKRNLQRQLADIQHANYLMVVATMHVHLEYHHYLEVLLVQGPARELRRLADTLAGTKGVQHARLHLTATAMPPLL
jgi:CopG family transcriptional regulator, nickel-responsive regulator